MAFTINIYYTGKDGNARKFAEEMKASGATFLAGRRWDAAASEVQIRAWIEE